MRLHFGVREGPAQRLSLFMHAYKYFCCIVEKSNEFPSCHRYCMQLLKSGVQCIVTKPQVVVAGLFMHILF